jgi:hypothetical protein
MQIEAFASEKILLFVSILLLTSMGLHFIELHHEHPEAMFGGEEVQAYLHGGDRKWWLVFIALFVLCQTSNLFRTRVVEVNRPILGQSRSTESIFSRLFDPLVFAFRSGVLHSKICD